MRLTFILFGVISLGLGACLETQTAPELPSFPSTDFNVEAIIEGLDTPWSVAELPTGGFLITEKRGALKRVSADGQVTDISGLPTPIFTQQQAGLLDVVLAPDYITSRRIYLVYAYGDANSNGTAVFTALVSEDGTTLEGGVTIFKASPDKDTGSHFGGRLVFLPYGSALLSTGDGFTYREAAQDKTSHFGKILKLSWNAPGTPAHVEIYSYGHRNVQGLFYDSSTQKVWAHEHGPRGGDELNLIKQNANYGWPLATTGSDYTGAKISPFETYEGTEPFVKDWTPSIAPSGLTIYDGDMFSGWKGDAFIGGLAAKSLRRVDLENGQVVGEDILLADLGARIRDVRVASDGALLVLANTTKDEEDKGGVLWRITPKD